MLTFFHTVGKKHQKLWKYKKWFNNSVIFMATSFIFNPDSPPLPCFLTLVSRFTGFPRSHSTWEPFWFAWHLIYNQSEYQTNTISKKTEIQNLAKKDFSCRIPVAGPWSRHTTECSEGRWAAERHGRHPRPHQGAAGQRACWWRWSPTPPTAGLTGRTPARHPHLCMGGKKRENTHLGKYHSSGCITTAYT